MANHVQASCTKNAINYLIGPCCFASVHPYILYGLQVHGQKKVKLGFIIVRSKASLKA